MSDKPETRSQQQNRRHGMYGTPTYSSWASMHARCKGTASNPAHYAEKGVKVCEAWRNFRNFLADMGERPEGATLDRFPNGDGNYEPGNCRWATKAQQCANRSNAVLITHEGKTQTARAWALEVGISDTTVRARLRKGWPLDLVLSPKDFHCNSGRRHG